jgi:aquaporin TIP
MSVIWASLPALHMGKQDLSSIEAWRAASAEFLSSFMFVFLSVTAAVTSGQSPDSRIHSTSSILTLAVGHGFAFACAVSFSSTYVGGCCNPAVAFGMFLKGHISLIRLLMYALAQVCGSLLAALFVSATVPLYDPRSLGFSVSVVRVVGSPELAFALETVGATFLSLLVFQNSPESIRSAASPVLLGFFVTASSIGISPFADPTFNPARSLAVAVVGSSYRNLWVPLLAPFFGSSLAALFHELLLQPEAA